MSNSTSQGWTASSDGRGSFDILWSCLATIFLSTWSAICLNVPDPQDTVWTHVKRKSWLTVICVMGPEYQLGFALSEWQSARASVAHFKQNRQDDRWTIRHAFFADMGGFAIRTKDDVQWFLDTKQLAWLLKHKALTMDEFEDKFLLDTKIIEDRNKSDTFVRVVAVGQAMWFCVNVIARGAQGLAVTTLEVSTIGIIINSVLTYYVWRNKPCDVESIGYFDVNMTLNELILLEENEEARSQPYFRTPLDLVSRQVWNWYLIYHYNMNILRHLNPLQSLRKPMRGSLHRRSENKILPLTRWYMGVAASAALAFLGINFVAWNVQFPAVIEKWIWRAAAVGFVTIYLVGLPVMEVIFGGSGVARQQESTQRYRKQLQDTDPKEVGLWVYQMRKLAMKIRNNSLNGDPNLDLSLRFAVLGSAGLAIYSILRLYILVDDIIAFRAMPASAFDSVNWWIYVPSIN